MSLQLPAHFTADFRSAMAFLGEPFFDGDAWIRDAQEVQAEKIPLRPRQLLVHNQHMTATLQAHYQQPVELHVLKHREQGDVYGRKILLTINGGRLVVEFGLVRLNLAFLPVSARQEVVSRSRPLGEILARHNILTRVEPRWYVCFLGDCQVVQWFASAAVTQAYGRIGVIYCDGQPAVELLEVVPG